jgi:Zn-dependent M28 family amino/carboxypeptidase
MHRSQVFLIALFLCAAAHAATFSGAKAFAYTRAAVADGPRPSGSEAIRRLQGRIIASLKTSGCQLTFDDFRATTPAGPAAMRNILCKFPGSSGRAIVITGHYDTKRLARFVGANDGGSSTGFLMELANALRGVPRIDDVILVFFDGEEAVKEWTDTDSLYGSRHLETVWSNNGMLAHIKALINVDMIGDKDLDILKDGNSDPRLRDLVWNTADELGYAAHFHREMNGIEDDHVPFLRAGVHALDLIDFTYGPNQAFWHTGQDTMDKLSPNSFEIVGNVVLAVIRKLEELP